GSDGGGLQLQGPGGAGQGPDRFGQGHAGPPVQGRDGGGQGHRGGADQGHRLAAQPRGAARQAPVPAAGAHRPLRAGAGGPGSTAARFGAGPGAEEERRTGGRAGLKTGGHPAPRDSGAFEDKSQREELRKERTWLSRPKNSSNRSTCSPSSS